jgi:hypothetical protein
MMRVRTALSRGASLVGAAILAMSAIGTAGPAAAATTPIQVYGAWLCGDDECTWGTVRDMTGFDTANHWLIDRGDGRPSVNLVVLAFVNPLKLLDQTTDAGDADGLPVGMNQAVVDYFTSHGVRVMLSIGGITYTADWDTALAQDPTQLGSAAAAVAQRLGVGIEIDYENSASPDLTGLQSFVSAYRAQEPYDATGANPAARLTLDVGAGDRFLTVLDQYATANWLTTANPVIDYANAMVPNKQPSPTAAVANWQEHVDGKPNFAPPVPPLAPARFTGAVYLVGTHPQPECTDFADSLENTTGSFAQTVAPAGAGTTPGMLGYMFWAAEQPATRFVTTDPPDSCQGGVGVGATTYAVPVPMPALRQN